MIVKRNVSTDEKKTGLGEAGYIIHRTGGAASDRFFQQVDGGFHAPGARVVE
jgi:hypothetical protein